MHQIRLAILGALIGILTLLASCGGTATDAQQASYSQLALAATVAAGPTQAEAHPSPIPPQPTASLTATPPQPTASLTATPSQPRATTATASKSPATDPTSAQASAMAAASAEIATATARAAPMAPPVTQTIAPTQAAVIAATSQPSQIPTQVTESAATDTPAPTALPSAVPSQAAPEFACDSPCSMSFAELYSGASVTGPILSDKARALSGKQVIMRGFMAPPLSPDTTFFVLTKDPMVYCPFCNSAADWPFDIVYIKMAGGRAIPTMVPTTNLAVVGTFEVGNWSDPATGFVSLIRIFADSVEPIS